MTYKGIVRDSHDDTRENNSSRGGFETPQEASEWAKKAAEDTGYTGVDYWVEDEDISPIVNDYGGTTGKKYNRKTK